MFEERDEPLKRALISDRERRGERLLHRRLAVHRLLSGAAVPNTNKLKAFKLLSLAGAYWMGDPAQPQMQRIYGTAFFKQEELDAWIKQREEAERRDHRRLGRELICSRSRSSTDRA